MLGDASPTFLIRKEGETQDLYCDATATPEPSLSWFKDGKDLRPSERVTVSGNRVTVRNLERDDGGSYTCMFKNVVGQVTHVIKLVIEGKRRRLSPLSGEGSNYVITASLALRISLFFDQDLLGSRGAGDVYLELSLAQC